MTVRSEDAVEIVRATLALALPTASAEGLTRAAETVIRWGSEDVAQHLDRPLTDRLILDLLEVAGERAERAERGELGERVHPPLTFRPAEDRRHVGEATAAEYRTWSRTEGMQPLPHLSRPQEEPHWPDGEGGGRGAVPDL
ncbi:hypothetical protein [Kitasatospora terrestris]|uniref:Uncharacterized protein n=1 Tax=Kitasatospora terrestris TaxID=258051 RepID=A0ABP9DEP1_9ACTN